jgi:MbtH protein
LSDVPGEDTATYAVVVNLEEQYSIWRADREPPQGWRQVGKVGSKEECLAYIGEVWTDMRPLSVRQRKDDASGLPPSHPGDSA